MPTIAERLIRIETQNEQIARSLDQASRSRARLHERFDDVEATLSGLATTTARIAPLVDQHEAFIQRKIGGHREIKRMWVVGGKVAGWFAAAAAPIATWLHWDAFAAWLTRLTK